jgi:DNA-binding GntR family transcriptional regulator
MLRKAILDFDLKPGQRLVERELIEKIGVSRTTIREVLRELASEGLVSVVPQKGAMVAQLSADESADLYEARLALEMLVVRRFVERATDEQVAELTASAEEFAAVVDRGGDIREMLAAKDSLYTTLTTGAGSDALAQILDGLRARIRVLRATSLSAEGRPAEAVAEIRALVAAIGSRDSVAAADACADHVRSTARAGRETAGTPRRSQLSPASSHRSTSDSPTTGMIGGHQHASRVVGEAQSFDQGAPSGA